MESKKPRPDFSQWLETEDGKKCLAWPISDVKYLQNRLFWAFDAGRDFVWGQYIKQKEELADTSQENASLKLELQKLQNDLDDTLSIKNGKGPTAVYIASLRSELQKQKELKAELVKWIKGYVDLERFSDTKEIESLIKKSNEI